MQDPLVWIDLEMTGLDPTSDVILEVAAIITDGQLDHVIEGPHTVIHASEDQLSSMPEIVEKMHESSGLTAAVRASSMTVPEAEQTVLEFIKSHIPEPGVGLLAGNSVHADRSFLVRYMPSIVDHLHYRIVDVSTVKELARRWNPDLIKEAPVKDGDHRALADIRESIDELRYYRQSFFKEPAERQSPQ
ncbi:MAG: oligoribonuclease [Acidimicrobiia bacterium]|nr:oligoribonuclease [Acidimicrobiia bacterium]